VTFEVRTAVSLMSFVFWKPTLCRLVEIKGHFRKKICLLHKDRELRVTIRTVGKLGTGSKEWISRIIPL